MAFLADEPGVAEAAVFGAVVLLAGACEVGDLSVVWTFRSVLEGTWEFWMCVGLSGMWLGVDGAYRSRCERKVSFETRPKTMDERCIMEWGFLVGSTASDVQCHRSVEVAAAVEAVLLKPTGAMRDLHRKA